MSFYAQSIFTYDLNSREKHRYLKSKGYAVVKRTSNTLNYVDGIPLLVYFFY